MTTQALPRKKAAKVYEQIITVIRRVCDNRGGVQKYMNTEVMSCLERQGEISEEEHLVTDLRKMHKNQDG